MAIVVRFAKILQIWYHKNVQRERTKRGGRECQQYLF